MLLQRQVNLTPTQIQASGMGGLGVLPILAGAAAAAGGAGVVLGTQGVQQSYRTGWLDNLAQVLGLKPAPVITPAPSPASRPPVAPQTAWGMVNWSPDVAGESAAQRWVQFTQDTNWFQSQTALDMPQTGGGTPPPADSRISWGAVGLVALAAIGGLLLIGRKGQG